MQQLCAAVNWLSVWLKMITSSVLLLGILFLLQKLHLRQESERKRHFSFDHCDLLETRQAVELLSAAYKVCIMQLVTGQHK